MKRNFNEMQNSNSPNTRYNAVLEGVVVAVTDIFNCGTDQKGKYWTALICDINQNMNRLTKYLSSKSTCRLHENMKASFDNQSGIKMNKLKLNGDHLYTACNDTIAIPKVVSFTPSCTQNKLLQDIESMCNGQYTSMLCKIIDIGPDDSVVFDNGGKRVEKLKRTILIADKSNSINLNIWENQFDLIKLNACYAVKLVKVKIFNEDVSITTTAYTTFQSIDDIGDVTCSNAIPITYETTIMGTIISLGLVEETIRCPNCYSNEIETNEKTIKCLTCKSRSINTKQNIDRNRIKLNVVDIDGSTFGVIGETTKIQTLLKQCNREDLSNSDLIENEEVLISLSTLHVGVRFNPKTKHLIDIMINGIDIDTATVNASI